MARPLRLAYPGALYHITARGNEKHKIFVDDRDFAAMLEKMAASVSRYRVRLYAYVLMGNHYHLIASTPRGNLSRFMQHLKHGWWRKIDICST
jgi:putative transposase